MEGDGKVMGGMGEPELMSMNIFRLSSSRKNRIIG